VKYITMEKYQYEHIKNVLIENINRADHPDYTDAFVSEAEYMGETMTDKQLDDLNEDYELVHLLVFDYLH